MLFGRQASRVLVYEHPVDMRKSFDGLYAVASQGAKEDVLSGSLFLFVNRSKTILKVLSGIVRAGVLWRSGLSAGGLKYRRTF